MDESEENGAKRPSRSRRKRQLEKKQASEAEEADESGEDRVVWTSVSLDEALPDVYPTAKEEAGTSAAEETRKPKTRKKTSAAADEASGSVPKKKKKRRKKTPRTQPHEEEAFPPHTILRDVAHLGEDVVEVDGFVPSAATTVWHTAVRGQPEGRLFVESRGAFKALDKQKLMTASSDSPPSGPKTAVALSAADHCLRLRSVIRKVATSCHGLLAGFALWLCVTVYCLGPPRFPLSDFLVHYSPLASAVQAIFYSMTAVCIVSLMGSINVGGDGSFVPQLRGACSGLAALVIYVVTLLLSLSIADKDDALSLYARNATLPAGGEDDVLVWRNANLCRCLGAILAWLVLAFCPQRDLLKRFLRAMAAAS